MSKKKEEIEEVEEVEEVEEEPKKGKRDKESVEKRKRAKKVDAISRWSGVIFLGLILLVGLLLWVGGEMGSEQEVMQVPTSYSARTTQPSIKPSLQPKVIIE